MSGGTGHASDLSLITVDIGRPSRRRAKRQFEWLSRRDDDVFVLTETNATAGSQLLADKFAEAGYSVTWPDHAF
jgi:exodeoxyribonuclease-3